ncbi:MAG: PEP-CTERM sorting domain-containing protein [Planctomycetota bacterium]
MLTMRGTTGRYGLAGVVGTAAALGLAGPAAGVEVIADLSGHFDITGSFVADESTNQNYSTGFLTDPLTSTLFVRRSFFIFDLTAFSDEVIDATLALPQAAPPVPIFASPDGFEIFLVTTTLPTEAEIRDPSLFTDPDTLDTGPGAVFAQLGTGDLLGDLEVEDPIVFAPDPPPAELFVPLSSPEALTYINDAIGGTLILSARLFSDEIFPPDSPRFVFAGTNPGVPPPFTAPTPPVFIDLTFVPEPGTGLVALAGASLLGARRRRQA